MLPSLTSLADIKVWAGSLSSLMAFTGNPDIIKAFSFADVSKLSVSDYLKLLDTAELGLTSYNWAIVSAQLPAIRATLQAAGLPAAAIETALGAVQEFISGDLSEVTNGFDVIRGELAGFAPGTILAKAIEDGAPTDMGVTLNGNKGKDVLDGTAFDDKLNGKGGADRLNGEDGADNLIGGGGKDVMYGDGGGDKLFGGGGGDRLYGGGGKDVLKGGKGGDKIAGGGGNDNLFGGGGADNFVFKSGGGFDKIKDFNHKQDHILMGDAATLDDIDFIKKKGNVLLKYDDVKVLVEDIKLGQIMDEDIFF